MQNNGFGTSHPKAAAPYVMVLLEHREAAKVSTWKLEREARRIGWRAGGTLYWQQHYHHKEKSYEKDCCRMAEMKWVNTQSSWLWGRNSWDETSLPHENLTKHLFQNIFGFFLINTSVICMIKFKYTLCNLISNVCKLMLHSFNWQHSKRSLT